MTVIRQHPLYTKLMKADPDEIIADLVELQSILIRTAPFFQVAARSPMDVLNIVRGAWTAEGGQLVEDGETHFKQVYVRTASGSVSSRSVIAPIVGVESAYMQVLVECDVPRQHEDFYPLEVRPEKTLVYGSSFFFKRFSMFLILAAPLPSPRLLLSGGGFPDMVGCTVHCVHVLTCTCCFLSGLV